jgi:hypothetical protein
MQEHSRYEELCAAAAAGQISAEELTELRDHTEVCNFCKDLQREFVEIGSFCLTEGEKLEPEIYDPELALRKKILERVQKQGASFSRSLQNDIATTPRKRWIFFGNPLRIPTPVWGVALIVCGAALGLSIASVRYRRSEPRTLTSAIVAKPALPTAIESFQPFASINNSAQVGLERGKADLEQRFRASQETRNRLQGEVAELTTRLAALRDSEKNALGQLSRLQTAVNNDHDAAAAAQAQLQKVKNDEEAKDAELVAAQYRLRDLERKLTEQGAATERYRQLAVLSSSSELRDVVAARNLHIIDVADVDNGGVRKPFGRVFYTEGKSLIFYAYDLSNAKGRQTFFAWGHRDGDPHTTRPLGALENDDESQKRWVFRFNDAKVLAQIDSVYVTLEPSDQPGAKPRGKRLLKAFLGTPPNHP